MAVLGLIGARAGSKRLPRKHLLSVGDKPLIQHTFQRAMTLLDRDVLDACYVSSDDPEVRKLAQSMGLSTNARPPSLAADDTPDRAWVHDLMQMSSVPLTVPDVDTIVLMRPTSPFLTADTVQAMVQRFQGSKDTALITAKALGTIAKCWNEGRTWYACKNETEQPYWASLPPDTLHEYPSENDGYMRAYVQTGGCDVIRASNLPGSLRGDRVDLYEVFGSEALDLNEPWDLELARAIVAAGLHAT